MIENIDEVLDENISGEKKLPFWNILYKNLVWILLSAILFGAVAFGLSAVLVKKTYTANYDVMVKLVMENNNYTNEQLINNNVLAKNYIPTIVQVIQSPNTVSSANKKQEGVVLSGISTSYKLNSLIIKIGYSDKDKDLATKKLDAVIQSAQEDFDANEKTAKTEGEEQKTYSFTVKLVKMQSDSNYSVSDKKTTITIIGALVGLLGSAVFFLIHYSVNNKIKTQEEIEEITGTDLLSTIEK